MKHDYEVGRAPLAYGLATDHEELEQLFARLVMSLRSADSERVRQRWLELDHALEQHLSTREELILPQLERDCPADAARVRAEHRVIRTALVDLGIDLDLHALSPESATRFIDALRRHATFEDAVIYPWAECKLAEHARLSLRQRLRGRARIALGSTVRSPDTLEQRRS